MAYASSLRTKTHASSLRTKTHASNLRTWRTLPACERGVRFQLANKVANVAYASSLRTTTHAVAEITKTSGSATMNAEILDELGYLLGTHV